jgi:hypothetical protein
MLGLILAGLYVAYAIVINSVAPVVAVEATLGFLWWWHIIWGAVLIGLGLLMPLLGAVVATENKALGIGLVAASPVIMFFICLIPALFLGGVYAIDSGIQGGEIVNQSHVIVGSVLYGLGVLLRLSSRNSSSKD